MRPTAYESRSEVTKASGRYRRSNWPRGIDDRLEADVGHARTVKQEADPTVSGKVICPTGEVDEFLCQPLRARIFFFRFYRNYALISPFRADEGAYASSRTWCGMRWTGRCREMSGTDADGEVVWSWRAHAGAKFVQSSRGFARATVANAGSPGRSRISRKPSRREGRCDPRLYLWFSRSRKCLLREAPGAAASRPSLRPRLFERASNDPRLGRIAQRGCGRMSLAPQ
jgi:hypothetical protein